MFRRLNYCFVDGYAPLCLDSNDPYTVECAFKKRLLRDVPVANKNTLTEFANFVNDFVRNNIPKVRVPEFEEWLSGTSYNDNRKSQLRGCYELLRGGFPSRKQCSHIDTFVKTEYYTEWKHCRMINSRSDAFKVFSGPIFKAIESVVYELEEFIKHTPVTERPEKVLALWQAGMFCYQTDFTAFESHFVPAVLDICECALYRWCIDNKSVSDLICSTLMGKNRMRTRTGIIAEVHGRRMSGDMCTSLGNGFTNLMLAKFIAFKQGCDVHGFVEGDDGLFLTKANLTTAHYADLGFSIKVEKVPNPCEASFCGMIFSGSCEIIRDPRRVLAGFGWTHSFINAGPRIMDELLRAKALSSVYETPQCPIIGALSRYALSVTSHVHPRFVDDGFHRPCPDVVNVPVFQPHHDTRVLFEAKYGISISVQLAAENAIRRGDFQLLSQLVPPPLDVADYASKYVEMS
jgi:hypothetical protein